MARKATGHSRTTSSARTARKSTKKTTAVARRPSSGGGSRSDENMGDAFIKLLQSPFVAELVAVAATAALASLAELASPAATVDEGSARARLSRKRARPPPRPSAGG